MDPILGEIKLFAINIVPKGWAPCNGTLLPIAQNQALYSLLGTYYGGDGRNTFALPDLRGRVPVATVGEQPGASGGTEIVTLTAAQVPPHTHEINVSTAAGDQTNAIGHHIAAPANNNNLYIAATGASTIALDPATVDTQGGNGNHNNMQPFLTLNYYIATAGVYPQRP
ncbi:phage tail protein [Methylomonas fluvii]|uniref:Phage tail protein n=1 Tax=Methylomonas fluvii TaxID=1854564 RepID=A0ABR9DH90_9GAMM|nr:tail fiber protein [Methylomonas fluvii]MBD9362472.1 phage tail protein [Methylomonas fluvii]CAD6875576.1 Microcystin dependent protein [Methylomonas fluvii]